MILTHQGCFYPSPFTFPSDINEIYLKQNPKIGISKSQVLDKKIVNEYIMLSMPFTGLKRGNEERSTVMRGRRWVASMIPQRIRGPKAVLPEEDISRWVWSSLKIKRASSELQTIRVVQAYSHLSENLQTVKKKTR